MLASSLSRFRLVALLEGISSLVLFFVAMPLKYMAGLPIYVKYVGWAHGVLFMAYFVALLGVYMDEEWGWKKVFWAIVASIFPFGTFVFDAKVLKYGKATS